VTQQAESPDPNAPKIVFSCTRNGLAETLERRLLGGYDGAGAWVLDLANITNGQEQQMVETHEALHHELQASAGLGLVTAMASMLARRGIRRHALREFFLRSVDGSQATHELFATTLSAVPAGITRSRELLRDNPTYLAHLERGLALGGTDQTPLRYRELAASAITQCCMAPAGVLDLLDTGFGTLTWRLIRGGMPDERLAAVDQADGRASWSGLLADLAAEYPDFANGDGDPDRRHLPDDPADLAELRVFEEDIMLRRCYEHACDILSAAGLPSVAWSEREDLARAVLAQADQVDPDLAERLNLVSQRRSAVQDMLEYDRQQVRLRPPLTAQVLTPDTTPTALDAFTATDEDGDPHACGVWLASAVVRKQFAVPQDIALPDPVVALLIRIRTADGSPVVRLGLLPSSITPRACQQLLGDVPLLVLTTHFTLVDDAVSAQLGRVEPVFVLMDLPVAWHVEHWFQQGAQVRVALLPLEGVGPVDLDAAVFGVDRAPGFRFVHIGGRAPVSLLLARLREQHGDRIVVDADLIRSQWHALNLVVSHVFACWHRLDQDAVE
jgi:hypothetical protein